MGLAEGLGVVPATLCVKVSTGLGPSRIPALSDTVLVTFVGLAEITSVDSAVGAAMRRSNVKVRGPAGFGLVPEAILGGRGELATSYWSMGRGAVTVTAGFRAPSRFPDL